MTEKIFHKKERKKKNLSQFKMTNHGKIQITESEEEKKIILYIQLYQTQAQAAHEYTAKG